MYRWIRYLGIASVVGIIGFVGIIYSEKWLGYKIYHIPSQSMSPALSANDYVLVKCFSTVPYDVNKGDVVVFHHPYKDGAVYIKRVAYLPGEKFLGEILEENEMAVFGDNRDRSEDSRHFGAIDQSLLIGKAIYIVYSVNGPLRTIDPVLASIGIQ